MSAQLQSIFHEISEEVFQIPRLDKAQSFIIDFVSTKNINNIDRNSILKNVTECKNIAKLQAYICNSLLQYEGLSVNKKLKN